MNTLKDLTLRFILGGSSVALCYIVLLLIPYKTIAGIFAAFPAVMVAAVIMAGVFEGSKQAADVALGASAGMMGCTVCVITAYLGFIHLHSWYLALAFSLLAWLISSVFFIRIMQYFFTKIPHRSNR